MFNALSLWAVAAYVFYETYERLVNHHAIEINGPIMLSVGGVGLLVNILAAKVLHSSAEHSLNVEGATEARYGRPHGLGGCRDSRHSHRYLWTQLEHR